MQIQYLYNSGFIVELKQHILLFDYYKGKLPEFNKDIPLYVFVSHSHRDHYNPDIYKIDHPNITYIISNDIDNQGIKVAPNQELEIDDLHVSTLTSTDLGVAFIVHVENRNIYHAGDLHWWHWVGEPKEDNDYQKQVFIQEINKIKDIDFDIMMIPLDPRLEYTTTWGMEHILKTVNSKYVFPMHFMLETKTMLDYLKTPPLKQYQNIIAIHQRGEIFVLEDI